MKKIAHIISTLFFPMLMPLYGLGLLFSHPLFHIYPKRYATSSLMLFLLWGLIFPISAIIAFYLLKLISDLRMRNREDRTLPILVLSIGYIFYTADLYKLAMPTFVTSIGIAMSVACLIVSLVSLKWKISGHMTGIGGLIGAIVVVSHATFINPVALLITAFFIAGLVASARLELNRHTPAQILAGFANGFGCSILFYTMEAGRIFRFFY